jgi:hypothetical protein
MARSAAVRLEWCGLSDETIRVLRASLANAAASDGDPRELTAALGRMALEARACYCPPDRLVAWFKEIWGDTTCPARVPAGVWQGVYRTALTCVLAIYFDDEVR